MKGVKWFAFGIVAVLAGGLWYAPQFFEIKTDNAYVSGDVIKIGPEISGVISHLEITQGQYVNSGQLLFSLRKDELLNNLLNAQLKLEEAKGVVRSSEIEIQESESKLLKALAEKQHLQRKLARYETLKAKDHISQLTVSDLQYELAQAELQVKISQNEIERIKSSLLGGNDSNEKSPIISRAELAVEVAKRKLALSDVYANKSGWIGKLDLKEGSTVEAFSSYVALIVEGSIHIVANFKENEFEHIAVGQVATVQLDYLPNRSFRARVESISPATNSTFTSSPSNVRSGNWIKVVQHIPVRLKLLNEAGSIPIGSSAIVKIDSE